MHIANPEYLLLLIWLPVFFLWQRYIIHKGERHIVFSAQSLVGNSEKSLKIVLIRNLYYVKIAALLLLILAASRPQILNYFQIENKKGIDILVTVDISGSMAAMDFVTKNRLEVAKEVISNFIKKRKTDRIGLVVFAGASYTKCPLTIDYELIKDSLQKTELGELEDGTALGMALATSVNRIIQYKTTTKVIILLTDGVNNRGEIDPRDAANIARDFKIKVYTIGVGTRGKAPFPITGSGGRTQHVMVDVEIDEALLKEIASKTGGLYFRATDQNSLQKIFQEIDRWEKSEVTSRTISEARELYHYFILFGLALLLLVEFSSRSWLRSLP